jgi:uncharacterized protein (DUF302 family)
MKAGVQMTIAMLCLLGLPIVSMGNVSAQEHEQALITRTKAAPFEDVKFELDNAITERGFVVDRVGDVAAMLDRTGADVGSTKKIYLHAEYIAFCSAKLSRAMMEADPGNLAFCPFVVFLYERADKQGEIVVGTRPPPILGNAASRAALADVQVLLKGIVEAAVK